MRFYAGNTHILTFLFYTPNPTPLTNTNTMKTNWLKADDLVHAPFSENGWLLIRVRGPFHSGLLSPPPPRINSQVAYLLLPLVFGMFR